MIFDVIGDFIVETWKADTKIRTSSALGESESSKKDRKVIAILFSILLITLVGIGVYFGV